MAPHPDPWRAVDRQPDPAGFARMMESRGRTPTQVRVRRRFLRFCRIEPGWRVLEVGSGSGVVARDLAALVGPRGHVTGVDKSRVLTAAARRAAREAGLDWSGAVVEAYLAVLAALPDTHIARKLGPAEAEEVSRRAAEVQAAGGVRTDRGRRALAALDAALRSPDNRRNPGTTADLTCAAVFVVILEGNWHRH